MTKGQRTVVSLLAVVAVLLGLNLIVGGSTPAAAQAQGMGRPPQAVAMLVGNFGPIGLSVFRMFSDGTVELNSSQLGPFDPKGCPVSALVWCGWEAIPE